MFRLPFFYHQTPLDQILLFATCKSKSCSLIVDVVKHVLLFHSKSLSESLILIERKIKLNISDQ